MNTSFIHIADCHLGSWRNDKLRTLSQESFAYVVTQAIEKNVDFCIISGDLFNTALPAIEVLKFCVTQLQRLKKEHIPVYCIAGSHDYSSSGKSMLDVLEEAQLLSNIFKAHITDENVLELQQTTDTKTGITLYGMLGRAQSLEKNYYQLLDRERIEKQPGRKIFLFHSAITELKPKSMEKVSSPPISFLPKNCMYYAGGHVHYRFNQDIPEFGRIVYPGPVFPNNFAEIEELSCGSYAYTQMQDKNIQTTIHTIPLKKQISITLNCTHLTPQEVTDNIIELQHDYTDAIVTIRLFGKLQSGTISQIDFETIYETLSKRGTYTILKNTTQLYQESFLEQLPNVDSQDRESALIDEHINQVDLPHLPEKELITNLMTALDQRRQDGETVSDFEKRILLKSQELFSLKK